MTRNELLAQLSDLPHPIVTDIAVFDDNVSFRLLTPTAGYGVLVGGAFPIIGPLSVSASQRQALDILSAPPYSEGEFEGFPWHGDEAMRDLLELDPAVGQEYYMFHDIGRGVSAVFQSLKETFDYFVNFYTEVYEDEIFSWSELSDDDLSNWAEAVQQWRAEGAERFPPKDVFGVWYSAAIGGGQIGREEDG